MRKRARKTRRRILRRERKQRGGQVPETPSGETVVTGKRYLGKIGDPDEVPTTFSE